MSLNIKATMALSSRLKCFHFLSIYVIQFIKFGPILHLKVVKQVQIIIYNKRDMWSYLFLSCWTTDCCVGTNNNTLIITWKAHYAFSANINSKASWAVKACRVSADPAVLSASETVTYRAGDSGHQQPEEHWLWNGKKRPKRKIRMKHAALTC